MQIDIPTSEIINGKTAEKLMVSEMLRFNRLTLTDAVKKHNELYPDSLITVQNLSNKISRNSLKIHDFAALAEACGFKLTLISNNTNISVFNQNTIQNKHTEQKEALITQISLIEQGYCMIDSVNFDNAIIVGNQCKEAAKWIINETKNDMLKGAEIRVWIGAKSLYNVDIIPVVDDKSIIEKEK